MQPVGNLQAQVAKTQWVLFVELHQFNNLYNAEVISSGGFCCCGIEPANYDNNYYCNKRKAEYLPVCSPSCDTWLHAEVSHCIDPYPCSFSTEVHLKMLQ